MASDSNLNNDENEINTNQNIKNEETIQENYELNQIDQADTAKCKVPLRRSGRKSIRPLDVEKPVVLPKIKKLNENSSSREVEKYYLDKRIGRSSTLETIFEDSEQKRLMSVKKYKRFIDFKDSASSSKSKLKSRQKRTRLYLGNKKSNSKVTMEHLKETLEGLKDD